MKKLKLLIILLSIANFTFAGIPMDSVNAWKKQADKLKTDLNTYETIRIYAKSKSMSTIPLDSVNAWKTQANKDKVDLNTYITGLILLYGGGGSTPGIITGTLTTNYLSVATGTNTIGNSLIYQNSGNLGINTTSSNSLLQIDYPNFTSVKNLLNIRQNYNQYSVLKVTDIGASAGSKIESDYGYWGLGTSADNPGGNRFTLKGSGSTSSTGAFVVFNGLNQLNFLIFDNGQILAPHLPTSSAGLSSGQIWNNAGVLNIVP